MQEISDGTITVKLGGKAIDVDLLVTKLAIEPVEEKYKVSSKEWKATPDFLRDLAAAVESVGISPCTPTAAYQVWEFVTRGWADLKKSMDATPN